MPNAAFEGCRDVADTGTEAVNIPNAKRSSETVAELHDFKPREHIV